MTKHLVIKNWLCHLVIADGASARLRRMQLAVRLMACIWAVAIGARYCEGAEDDPIPAILRDWQERREAASAVRYVTTGTLHHPKGTWKGDPMLVGRLRPTGLPDDVTMPYVGEWLISFSQNWFRFETDMQLFNFSSGEFQPCKELFAFDGDKLRSQDKDVTENRARRYAPDQPDFFIKHPSEPIFHVRNMPLLAAHGFVFREESLENVTSLQTAAENVSFIYQGTSKLNGIDCVVLRTKPSADQSARYLEVWVDKSHKSAPVSLRSYFSGQLRTQADIVYGQDGNGWWPISWSTSEIDSRTKQPSRRMVSEVTKRDMSPAVERKDFELVPRPGMVVSDGIQQKGFVVDSSGTLVDIGSERGKRLLFGSKWDWWRATQFGIASALAGGIGLWLLGLSRRRS